MVYLYLFFFNIFSEAQAIALLKNDKVGPGYVLFSLANDMSMFGNKIILNSLTTVNLNISTRLHFRTNSNIYVFIAEFNF